MASDSKTDSKTAGGQPGQARTKLPELTDVVQLDHDLRATLADLAAGLELVGEDAVAPGARPAFRRARASLSALSRLLEHSLTAAAQPHEALGPAVLDLARFAADLRDRWHRSGHEGEQVVEVTFSPGLPSDILADRVALERLTANLIWNALRHSRSGRVGCQIEVDDATLRIVVSDQGPGFSQAILAGAPAAPRASSGSGLGLHIARAMAARLGGRLDLANPLGGGAAVTFQMPRALRPEAGNAASDAAGEPVPDLSGLRILVADDSESMRLVIGQLLASMGAHVEIQPDGRTALEAVSSGRFHAVILDVEMPGLGGFEVLQALRESPVALEPPATVILTGHSGREVRESLRLAGADAVLVKPVLCPFALGEAVLAAIGRRAGDRANAALALTDAATLERLLQIAGPVAGAELLVRLLDDLKTVEERLLAAFALLDFSAIRAQTHVLISVAGAVGATGLQHLAERVNTAANSQDAAVIKQSVGRLLTLLDALIQTITDRQARHSSEVI